jgi:hypothetical protein
MARPERVDLMWGSDLTSTMTDEGRLRSSSPSSTARPSASAPRSIRPGLSPVLAGQAQDPPLGSSVWRRTILCPAEVEPMSRLVSPPLRCDGASARLPEKKKLSLRDECERLTWQSIDREALKELEAAKTNRRLRLRRSSS